MDFFAESGLVLPPTAPAAGLESPATGKPAGMAAGFAELMRVPVDGALSKPQAAETPTDADEAGSGQENVPAASDLMRFAQPASATRPSLDASLEDRILASGPDASSEKPLTDWTSTSPRSSDAAMLASDVGTVLSDESPTLETREEQPSDRPASAALRGPPLQSEATFGSLSLNPEPVVAAPAERPPNGGASEPATQPSVPLSPDATLIPNETEMASSPSTNQSALAVALRHRANEPAGTNHAPDAKGSLRSDSLGSEPAREQVAPFVAQEVGRTIEPEQSRDFTTDGDAGNDAPSLEQSDQQQLGRESLVRGIEKSESKQHLLSDLQIGRLLHSGGVEGTGPSTHAMRGAPTESSLVITRSSDHAISVEAPAHPQHVGVHITKVLDQNKTAIRIELDPPELGEVDIDLEFRDLRLTATVRAERSDVLDLLQRDVRTLARALREAGVELADSDISFHGGRADHGGQGAAQRAIALPGASAAVAAPLQDLPARFEALEGFVSLSDGRMDLRA